MHDCYERECVPRKFTGTGPQKREETNFKIKLICRDDSSLFVKIVNDHDNDDAEDHNNDAEDDTNDDADDNTTDDTIFSNDFGNGAANHKYQRSGKGNLYIVKVEQTGNLLSENVIYIVSM